MKKLVIALLTASMLTPAVTAAAPQVAGYFTGSDIVVMIDDHPIPSWNKDGVSYVAVEDLAAYGFNLSWRTDMNLPMLSVKHDRTGAITADYDPASAPQTGLTPYYDSRIITDIGSYPVRSYNIGGKTLISMDDLARYFAEPGGYVWDGEARELRLYPCAHVRYPDGLDYFAAFPAEVPADGTIEFTRENGVWTALQPAGDVRSVGWLNLAADAVHFDGKAVPYIADAYAVTYEQTDGAVQWVRRPENLFAADGHALDPYWYDEYLIAAPDYAAAVEAAVPDESGAFRLYVNGERVDGVLIRRDVQMLDGRVITEEYSFVHGLRIAKEDIRTVRIEFGGENADKSPFST